jgi:hypothetical protein
MVTTAEASRHRSKLRQTKTRRLDPKDDGKREKVHGRCAECMFPTRRLTGAFSLPGSTARCE